MRASAQPLDARAWLAWVAAAIVALSSTRNPLYLLLIVLCAAWVGRTVDRALAAGQPAPLPLGRLAGIILVLSALFNLVTAHVGRTVLFSLPSSVPLLGGPYTLEALVFGAINGLMLVGFVAVFNVLYRALPTAAWIGLLPRAFYPVAVVASIAVSYVPATLAQLQQIREAQTLRGHRVTALRDWLPLLMPLLVGGLERSMQLAEAMTARGFGSLGAAPAGRDWTQPALAGGLMAALAGALVMLFWQQKVLGWTLVAAGAALLALALRRQGQRTRRTRYHAPRWGRREWMMLGMAALAVVGYVWPAARSTLAYPVYPLLKWPGFSALVIAATLLLAWPAVMVMRRESMGEVEG